MAALPADDPQPSYIRSLPTTRLCWFFLGPQIEINRRPGVASHSHTALCGDFSPTGHLCKYTLVRMTTWLPREVTKSRCGGLKYACGGETS